MSEFQISWKNTASGKRQSRKLADEREASGFVKGLRIAPEHDEIAVWKLEPDGGRSRVVAASLTREARKGSPPNALPEPAAEDATAEVREFAEAEGPPSSPGQRAYWPTMLARVLLGAGKTQDSGS